MTTTDSDSPFSTLFSVAGKNVLVTGGSRGIGLAIAEGFVRAGARVYVCSRSAEACAAAAKELSQYGECHALAANLGSAEECRSLAAQLAERETRLDVLVNNAGAIWAEKLEEYPESGWDKVFNLNVKGPFFLVKSLLPLLKAAAAHEGPARVITVGSIDGLHIPSHETYAYSSSKAAVHQLSRHLADQLAPFSITVNVIAPGMFNSKMLKGTLEQRGEEAMLAPVPLKRFANDTDMAGTAIFLASPAGSYITGAVLPVDGGTATTL
ncbi:SDR family oxidoreductase [Streptomyces sp. NBC_00873]|uniref:SDR family NAD(P)-dependent oxidoreductase n=1 Tax=unclassified Streptomyces TaxID=2593676 RepID=UPI003867BB89|nr:SDR family oxidoreductase [Streptomyces sp. NBC_00873]WTA47023.1 SDR family oxidoreductase [Streptomyces sp. NBC_00842]